MTVPSHRLYRKTVISAPQEEVFAFFSQAEKLDLITPPWLHFRILTPMPLKLDLNTRIDYALKINRIPVRWTTEISGWDPPHSFEDTQIKGPYRQWVHYHRFTGRDRSTVMEDAVIYRVPGWIWEPLIHIYFVRPKLDAIFDYREARIHHIFQPETSVTHP
jgi:ligand-binding SRPBCC domain-containing protein